MNKVHTITVTPFGCEIVSSRATTRFITEIEDSILVGEKSDGSEPHTIYEIDKRHTIIDHNGFADLLKLADTIYEFTNEQLWDNQFYENVLTIIQRK